MIELGKSAPGRMETERTRLKKQAKRTAILKAALEEFTENGFAKTRLATVAQKAGVAKGTLYLYFASKEELFAGVVEETLSPQEPYGEETSETSLRPEDRLSRFLLDNVASLRDSGRTGIALVVLTEGHLFPRLVDIYTQAVLTPILDRIRALAQTEESPRLKTIHRFPQLLMAPVLVGLLWNRIMTSSPPIDLPAIVKAQLSLALGWTDENENGPDTTVPAEPHLQ